MDLKVFYEKVGGDVYNALSRFTRPEKVEKQLRLFAEDETMAALTKAMEAKDYRNAHIEAHVIRTMAQNICLGNLEAAAAKLEVYIMFDPKGEQDALFAELKAQYDAAIKAISEI